MPWQFNSSVCSFHSFYSFVSMLYSIWILNCNVVLYENSLCIIVPNPTAVYCIVSYPILSYPYTTQHDVTSIDTKLLLPIYFPRILSLYFSTFMLHSWHKSKNVHSIKFMKRFQKNLVMFHFFFSIFFIFISYNFSDIVCFRLK